MVPLIHTHDHQPEVRDPGARPCTAGLQAQLERGLRQEEFKCLASLGYVTSPRPIAEALSQNGKGLEWTPVAEHLPWVQYPLLKIN